MRSIREQADRLRAVSPRYAPFADRLKSLAQRYESKALLALIERHRAHDEGQARDVTAGS
ncbi:MAG: hypothetical protein JWO52_1330 [Gammaproteobacteria bacterium]|jgi:hypothetical protein|nr:hypothetical protein [Gammaproteobacteria bacterium]